MNLFVDEPERSVRSGADWEHHRRHRSPQSGPPQDEVGALGALALVSHESPLLSGYPDPVRKDRA